MADPWCRAAAGCLCRTSYGNGYQERLNLEPESIPRRLGDFDGMSFFKILAGTTKQSFAGQCLPRGIVEAGNERGDSVQEIVFASHSAKCFGVNAAMSIPAAASISTIRVSKLGLAFSSRAANPKSFAPASRNRPQLESKCAGAAPS